ncbi:MAG: M48 family metalloprotease [Deltaproteobacteria bacterium]
MTKTRRLRAALIPVLVFALLLSPGSGPAFALSTEEERVAGEEFRASVRRQLEMLEDGFAEDYINDLGQYITRALETKPFPFQFYLVKDNTANAFAGPGGHIFFFSGLINMMDEVDELAAVLSHEIGHVSARHLSNRIEQNKGMTIAVLAGMLAGALMGGKAGGAIATGTLAAGVQKQLAYSREDERQADHLGFKYMDESRFNPAGMVRVLKKLERLSPGGIDALPPYLLTHPAGPERVSTSEALMSQFSAKAESEESVRFRSLFPYFKAVVFAKSSDFQGASRYFNKEREVNPESPVLQFGLGAVQKERMDYPRAIEHFEKALRAAPGLPPILLHLAETYQLQGQDRKAIEVVERVLRTDDRNKAALYLTAMSYQNMEEYSKATVFYERLVSMRPVKDEVYYNLGICYGREEKLALAHYNTGLYFQRVFDFQKARYHFFKADQLAGNEQGLKNRIHEAAKTLPREAVFSSPDKESKGRK